MFYLEAPPDTSTYMIAGYAVALIVLAIYLAGLFVRWRNLSRELGLLEEMEKEEK
jgi:hypothetical protein